MTTRRTTLKYMLSAVAAVGLSFSTLIAQAAPSQVGANKAIVERYLKAIGTSGFASVSKEVVSKDHKLLRHEFENLKYNAEGSELAKAAQPDIKAIPDRVNTITRILGEGDLVAATLKIKGTQKDNLFGIPATGKPFEIEAAAVIKLANGKIVESWFMAEEAKLLRQLNAPFPLRKDGKVIVPPHYNDTRSFDDALKDLMAKPESTLEYSHKKLLLAYKAKTKPADYTFTGKPYEKLLRGGIDNIVERGAELNVKGSHGQSVKDRVDTIANVIAEGNQGMFQFRLNAINGGPLYGIPASNNEVHDWEIGFADFDGEKWTNAWYMGDELGFLLSIGNKEALNYLVSQPAAK